MLLSFEKRDLKFDVLLIFARKLFVDVQEYFTFPSSLENSAHWHHLLAQYLDHLLFPMKKNTWEQFSIFLMNPVHSSRLTARLGAKRDLEVWTYDSDNSTSIQLGLAFYAR